MRNWSFDLLLTLLTIIVRLLYTIVIMKVWRCSNMDLMVRWDKANDNHEYLMILLNLMN